MIETLIYLLITIIIIIIIDKDCCRTETRVRAPTVDCCRSRQQSTSSG